MKDSPTRPRAAWLVLVGCTIILGLGSRRFGNALPRIIAENAGDALWALMVFFGFGILQPKASTLRVALCAFVFAFLIEFSQLIHAPWLDWLRSTKLGALALGRGFLWIDLPRYTAGILCGLVFEMATLRRLSHRSNQD